MKFEGDEVIFESTGRREYCMGDAAFSPWSDGSGISYGGDGGIDELTLAERAEVFMYMIRKWAEWLQDH